MIPFTPDVAIESCERLTEQSCIAVARYSKGDRSLVHQCVWVAVVLRKSTECARCSAAIRPTEYAFSPITDRAYRGARMCLLCAD